MKPIILVHESDPDFKLTISLPNGQAGEDAFAEFVNGHARGAKYQADYDFTRACAVEPKDVELAELLRCWSGVVRNAAQAIDDAVAVKDLELIDPRGAVAKWQAAIEKDPSFVFPYTPAMVEQWLRTYPRKGPPGYAQLGFAKFDFGLVAYRAVEPTEWFSVETMRNAGQAYQAFHSLVRSCVLSDNLADVLERAKTRPGIILILGRLIRGAAGEEFVKRMGE
jgi:hypothetical protein